MNAAELVPFRVLLYAHVDLNVIDGSAFFVAGAASLLTSAPGVVVDVVTATPIRRPVVVQEMLVNDRVTVTDPFADEGLAVRRPEFRTLSRMDEPTAASMLDHYVDQGRHDVVLVRSTEVADALAALRPDLGARLCAYVTGVPFGNLPPDPAAASRLQRLLDTGATLLCQTPEMQEHLARWLEVDASPGRLAVMSPAVPSEPASSLPGDRGPTVLAYTGKFAPAWNTVEMLAGFKEAASAHPGMRLVVAGDHFKRAPEWPTFAQEIRYLLGSHPDITWVGAVTREESRALVQSADVGLGWRSPELDESLELSTKVLEHGVLGRPCVINPTAMHRRLFGDDYPLFAGSMTEYVAVLGRLATDRALVREAAQTAMRVAQDYTYDRVFRQVFPVLVRAASAAAPTGDRRAQVTDVDRLLAAGDRLVEHDGWVVGWLTDSDDAARLLEQLGPDRLMQPAQALGPIVRWRASGPTDAADGGVPALRLVVELLARTAGGPATDASGTAATPSAPAVAHDRGGRVALAVAREEGTAGAVAGGRAPASGSTSTPASAPTPATATDAGAAELVAENARLHRKYEALSRSRLGRAQLWYWRLRSWLRRGRRSAD